MGEHSDIVRYEAESKAMFDRARRENEILKEVNAIKEIYSSMISSSSNYTNLVIIAGYAGYFSLLSAVKDGIPVIYMLLSAFLIVVSILTFVFYEVYKMYAIHSHTNRVVIALSNRGVLASEILNEVKREQQKFNLSSMKYWYVCLWLCLLAGLGATLVLLVALFVSFIRVFS